MDRTDLHFHLLPGLDDGPTTIDESIELARSALREGTTTIVATPHVRGDFVTDVSGLGELVAEVQDELRREGIGVSVWRGAELGQDMVGRLDQNDLEAVAVGPPGARWLLLETPFAWAGEELLAAIDELDDRGFAVMLAHPERSAGLLDSPDLSRLFARGVLLQVNALSLTGRHGAAAEEAARDLIALDRVDVIASDAHSLARPPALELGRRAAMMGGASAATAHRLTSTAPVRLAKRGFRAFAARQAA